MLQPSTKVFEGARRLLETPQGNLRRKVSLQTQWRFFAIALIGSDFVMIGLAFLLAYVVRFDADLALFQRDALVDNAYYRNFSLILNFVWILIFAATGLYHRNNLLGGFHEYSMIFQATCIGVLAVVGVSFLLPDVVLARGWLLMAWVLAFLFVAVERFSLRRFVYRLRQHGYFLSPALIVGANKEGCSLAQQLAEWRTSGLHVVGFVDDKTEVGERADGQLITVGRINELPQLVEEYEVTELILANSALSREQLLSLFKRFGFVDGLNLRLSSGLFEIITTGLDVREIAYTPLVRVRKVRLSNVDRLLKLALDYLVGIPALIGTMPLLLLIAIAVRLDSTGPIIYRRRVMGVNGRQFDAYKFRTMRVNGDALLAEFPEKQRELEETHKIKDDPRVTRVGQWLRKTSLDELPQMVNVLRREMSLVGPRIISPEETAMYKEWDMNLLTVHPGITGLWQVSGRSDVSYEERVRLDMHYIRNWSIWLDIQIIFQTIPAVLRGHGAY